MPVPIPASACCTGPDRLAAVGPAFKEHGFAVLRSFLSEEEVKQVRAEAVRFVEELPSLLADGRIPPEHVMYDDASRPSTLKQVQRLWQHDEYFGKLMEERFRPLCEAALGEAVVPQNMQYFNKPPLEAYAEGRSSQETPPHQDGYYFMISPQRAATLWLALDPADEENGCVRYVRGSSFRGMRKHDFSGIIGFSQRIVDYGEQEGDIEEEMVMAAEPGDLILHDSLMVHMAAPNRTQSRQRRAIGAILYGESAKVDQAAYEARQLEIRRRAARLDGQTEESVGLAGRKRPRPEDLH